MNREYIRWILEFKPPKFLPGFTPQQPKLSNSSQYAEDIISFCAASRDDLDEPEPEEDDKDEKRMLETDEEAIANEEALEHKALVHTI